MVKAARSPAAPKAPAETSPTKSASPRSADKPKRAAATKPSAKQVAAPEAKPKTVAKKVSKSRAEDVPPPAPKPATPAKAVRASAPKRAKPAATPPAAARPKASPASKPAASVPCAPVNLGFLSDFVGFHLRLAQDASYRAFARFKDKDLVKPGRFPALAIIHLNPGISQSALGRAIARDKSTVSPLIKDLQKNGLINRKPSPNDRRSVTLALTKKGERVLDRLHARALEHEGDLDKVIGASKSRLVGMLDKITGSLAAA